MLLRKPITFQIKHADKHESGVQLFGVAVTNEGAKE